MIIIQTGGEVGVLISIDNSLESKGLNFQQYADLMYNWVTEAKGFKLLEYNPATKLGYKKAFEILYKEKQGNREYLKKFLGIPYGENFLTIEFKSRDKYSNEMLPLANTVINSFEFIGNNTK